MIASEVFTSDVTLRAALVAGAALLVLILISNNKPARARAWRLTGRHREEEPAVLERMPVPLYRSPRWWERLAALTGLSVVAAVVGAVTAALIGGTLIFAVTKLTDLLR